VRVFRHNPDGSITERNFKSWSGGEKQRISFAIDFGLSRLIAERAENSYDVLILDEVFKHLDRSGKEAVVEMLQSLAAEKSAVFVVEHDAEFQSQFERHVVVQKKNRRSTIVEVRHGSQKGFSGAWQGTSTDAPAGVPVASGPIRNPVRRPVRKNG
jgi:ABC-type Mn2+/Zn2+ transport system ATPase subunit